MIGSLYVALLILTWGVAYQNAKAIRNDLKALPVVRTKDHRSLPLLIAIDNSFITYSVTSSGNAIDILAPADIESIEHTAK